MRVRHTPALLAFLVPLGTLHCSDPESGDSALLAELERVWAPSEQARQTPAPDHCRSVAAQRNVRVGGSSGESSCQFDEAISQLTCRTALGRSGEVTTSDFASVSDFVEAGHSLGKVTSLREVLQRGSRAQVTSHEYDELGRLIRSREERAGDDLVYTYGDFDDAGRPRQALPTSATLNAWGCEAAPLAIEYGDTAGTVRYQYRLPADCGVLDYSIIEHYDVLGNRMRVERESVAGVETTFEASVPAATQLLCD